MYAEGDFCSGWQYEGAHGEGMGGYGDYAYAVALWRHDGSSYCHGVAGAACGGVDDESVGLVGGEVLAVDVDSYAYH